MKKVCLQAGHKNRTTGATGAPQEREWTAKISDMVADRLRKQGVEVYVGDSFANTDSKVTGTDWDLFLALHYDADIYNDRGGFIDRPEPSIDFASEKSKACLEAIQSVYFPKTGIPEKPNRRNANTRYYYMWSALSAKTPCVIIECGVGYRKPEDYNVLRRYDFIADILTEGILKAIDVKVEASDNYGDIIKMSAQFKDFIAWARSAVGWEKEALHTLWSEIQPKMQALVDKIKELENKLKNILDIEITVGEVKKPIQWFITEYKNRSEQVNRLKEEKEQVQTRLDTCLAGKDNCEALNKEIKKLDETVQEQAKRIGTLEHSVDDWKQKYTALKEEKTTDYTLGTILSMLWDKVSNFSVK